MVESIIAFILGGATGFYAKDKIGGNSTQQSSKQQELASLYAENEKFSKRNKELERQVEDLLAELNKVRRQAKEKDDDHDDLEDDLEKAKRDLKNVRTQNDELARKVKEYKAACEALESEVATLKEKLR